MLRPLHKSLIFCVCCISFVILFYYCIECDIQCMLFYSVEANEVFDFRGVRLDWFRLQAYTSVSRAGLVLRDHQDLGKHLNMIVFHTKLVDYLDELINETGDLSIYWWLHRSIIFMVSFLMGEGYKKFHQMAVIIKKWI